MSLVVGVMYNTGDNPRCDICSFGNTGVFGDRQVSPSAPSRVFPFWAQLPLEADSAWSITPAPLLRVLPQRDDLQDGFQGGCLDVVVASTVQKDMAIMIEDEKVLRKLSARIGKVSETPHLNVTGGHSVQSSPPGPF